MLNVLLAAPIAAGARAADRAARVRALARGARDAGRAGARDRPRRRLRLRQPPGFSTSIDESWIPDLGRPLPARRRRDQRLPGPAHRGAVVRGDAVVGAAPRAGRRRARAPLLLPDRPGRDRHARRLPGPGPAAVRPLLRPDADPVLLRDRDLRRRAPDRGDDEDDRLHAGRLAADVRRRDRDGDPRLPGDRRALVLDRLPARAPALVGQPGVDLLLLRRRLPGQDAGLPDPRLDARRLPRGAAAGAAAALGGAVEGRRLRLPAGRAAAVSRGDRHLPGAGDGDRARPRSSTAR